MRSGIQILAFQLVWIALVWGAANGWVWIGLGAAGLFLMVSVVLNGNRLASHLGFLGTAAAIGFAADSALALAGVISFPAQSQIGWPVPLWMVALWTCFAATLIGPMRWLAGSATRAVAFGALGGPMAYYAGAKLGALALGPVEPVGYALIAMEWALALPVLAGLSRLTRLARVRRSQTRMNEVSA